jgi:hypothetical protein
MLTKRVLVLDRLSIASQLLQFSEVRLHKR